MYYIGRLLDISSIDPIDARRRKLLNVLLLGMATFSLVGLVATLVADLSGVAGSNELFTLYEATISVALGSLIVFLINRYGPGWLASSLFLLLLTIVSCTFDEPKEIAGGRSLLLFVVPIMMASVLLPAYASFIMAALSSGAISAIAVTAGMVPNPFAMIMFLAIGLLSWLSARSLNHTLRDLQTVNRELDQRVDERTRDLLEALAREHAEAGKNQAILEGIADGVIVFDQQGKALVANPAIGRLLERPSERLLGADIGALMADEVEDADQAKVVDLLKERGSRRSSAKFAWGQKTLSVSFAPVRSASGGVSGTVAVFRDFTREAEVDRMKSDFVSVVSHEVRTPLTSIKGYLDLVLMGASGPLNKQQQSFLSIAKSNAERLHELVSDLLDISRIESGKVELDIQVVSLPQVAAQVASSLEPEFRARGLTLTLDVPASLPEIFGDRGRIGQILSNLVSNAYKYTREGGATIRARAVGTTLQVDVIDTGVGIVQEDLGKLFTRFFRAEDAMVRQQPGTGLGLNITKSLVELHGGLIWVTSKPGVGSTFSFTLPLPAGLVHMAPTEAMPVDEPAALGIPSGPWIMVVDDEPDVAQLFRYQLQKAGYRVTVVTQGSRVVEVARQLQPELITLDLLMDVDGLTVLQDLKSDPATARIPVVIVSVIPEAHEGLALGAVDYLVKPLDEQTLLICVQRILDQLNGDSQHKILVVDDEIDIVGWLKHSLSHYGYQVSEAYDGVQALESVTADPPDLILLDLKMPRMDGRATIRRLREDETTRHIPIVVLSANSVSDEWDRTQMLGMGVRDFLKKPIRIDQLVSEVQKHLRR
jgi:PAS domain S-box-containing protein